MPMSLFISLFYKLEYILSILICLDFNLQKELEAQGLLSDKLIREYAKKYIYSMPTARARPLSSPNKYVI